MSGEWSCYNATFISVSVSIVANQSKSSNIFKGVLFMAREVICATNTTIQGYFYLFVC